MMMTTMRNGKLQMMKTKRMMKIQRMKKSRKIIKVKVRMERKKENQRLLPRLPKRTLTSMMRLG